MKIIIHPGFPKTGSSSLQFGPLQELEKLGRINLKTWRKNSSTEPLDDRPSSKLFNNEKILDRYLDFAENKLNVFSDESLTAPTRLRKLNFGSNIVSPFKFPYLLREQIFDKYNTTSIEISVIVVLRRQASLITSQYVEEYNWKRYKNIDLLFDNEGLVDLDGYDIYNYDKYLELLVSLYGAKNCFFLLYEEFLQNTTSFCSKLDNIFTTEKGFFSESLKSNHKNKKYKSKYGTFTKDGSFFVPHLRDDVHLEIDKHFIECNTNLIKYFSKKELQKYGYIN